MLTRPFAQNGLIPGDNSYDCDLFPHPGWTQGCKMMTMMALVLAGGLSVGLSVPPSCLPLEEVPIVITYEANAELRDMVVAGGGAAVPDSVWFEIDGPNGVVAYHEAPSHADGKLDPHQ